MHKKDMSDHALLTAEVRKERRKPVGQKIMPKLLPKTTGYKEQIERHVDERASQCEGEVLRNPMALLRRVSSWIGEAEESILRKEKKKHHKTPEARRALARSIASAIHNNNPAQLRIATKNAV